MKIKSEPFSEYPIQNLFRDYILGDEELQSFFSFDPFKDSSCNTRIEKCEYRHDRKKLVSILKDFNKPFNPGSETLKSIESLGDSNSVVIVTGQQMTMFGGPLFTIYKALSTIILAKRLNNKYKVNIIPVFWLADEDHDYEEISTVTVPVGDEIRSVSLQKPEQAEFRVSEFKFNSEISDFINELFELLPETDFTSELRDILNQSYKAGYNISQAFGTLMMSLFSKHGLVLAGSNSKLVKEFTSSILKDSILKKDAIFNELNETSSQLEGIGYDRQVVVQKSNLFWIDDLGNRKKLSVEGEKWFIGDDKHQSWSSDELIQLVNDEPNRFSPNVFLRPLIQDELLPTVGYVGGPGEISYYAQMNGLYKILNKEMPIIFPRISASLIESSIERVLQKLPFNASDYSWRIEDLESKYIEQADTPDLEMLFEDWKSNISSLNDKMIPKVVDIDPTLENTAGKAEATYFTELDKLKGKLYRSVKNQEKTQIDRINKIKQNLYPNNILQERKISFIYFMNKYGMNIWDDMIKALQDEIADSHKLIYL